MSSSEAPKSYILPDLNAMSTSTVVYVAYFQGKSRHDLTTSRFRLPTYSTRIQMCSSATVVLTDMPCPGVSSSLKQISQGNKNCGLWTRLSIQLLSRQGRVPVDGMNPLQVFLHIQASRATGTLVIRQDRDGRLKRGVGVWEREG